MIADELLRRRAVDVLGPHGHELAREALDMGELDVESGVATWEGSGGTIHGDRVVVVVREELRARIAENPGAKDDLTRAISTALAERDHRALYDLRVEAGHPDRPSQGPYRDVS